MTDGKQIVQPGIHLLGAQAKRGGQAKDGGHDGQDVDQVAEATVDALAEKWLENRADGERQAAVVGEVGQPQGHQGIERPGVQPPVKVMPIASSAASAAGLTPGWC